MTTINGAIITDFGSFDTGIYVSTQADGKIVVMGVTSGTTSDDLAVARYNSNGSLDTTFNGDGKLVATSVMKINAMQLLSDGKFLTVGSSGGDFAVARYNSDGSLDNSFSHDGKLFTNLGGSDDARGITVQADGRIIVVGANTSSWDNGVVRYNNDGSLDSSFGDDGIAASIGIDTAYYRVAVQPDGKVVVAGESNMLSVTRFTRDGRLDSSFGGGGFVSTDLKDRTDLFNNVYVLPNGKILAAGRHSGDFIIVRYNSDGSLDTSFGGDGIVTTDLGGTKTLTLADDKFLAAGTDDNKNFLLARYNADGSPDTSFSDDGIVTTDLGGWETGNSVTVQTDGKILLAGTTDTNFALARYNTDGSLDTTFNGLTQVNHLPTGAVSITGNTVEGQTLTASNTLADADGLGSIISYIWKTDSTVLGTGENYTVTTNELGKMIQVTASYTDGLGNPESVNSLPTSPVTAMPVNDYGISISSNGDFITDEDGSTAVFNVKLTAAPIRDVSVFFTSLDSTEAIISNPSLNFTSANWLTAQTFAVTGQDDTVADGNIAYQIKGVVNTIDVHYSDVVIDLISLTNNDNEINGETIYGDVGGSKADVLVGTGGNDKIYGLNMKDDLSGAAGNDELWGGYDNDVLFGDNGNDKLYGEQNDDYMDGGTSNDTLDGGLGVDTMIGGAGNDTYYLGYDAVDVINDNGLATDIDAVIMPYQISSYFLPKDIENGTISEGTQASSLTGNTGNNTLTGNDGKNTLNGAVGRDSLFGGLGNDVLNGGTGNDVLEGGTGSDKLTGGIGKDSFLFETVLNGNTDKITDFKPVDDSITLENAIFTQFTTTGVLNADNFATGASPHDMNDYLIYNPTTGSVTYDSDAAGAGTGVQIAMLGVNLALTNADFVII